MVNRLNTLKKILSTNSQACALFSANDSKLLLAHSSEAEAFLSPIFAARFVQQYFPLNSGDWVALNDPRSGGVTPFGINLIGRFENLVWSVRVESPKKWTLLEKWEQVGDKFPPLPLKLKGQINTQIPAEILQRVQPFIETIAPSIQKLENYLRWQKNLFAADRVQSYLQKTEAVVKSTLKESPWLETQHKAKTSSGEVLSLKLQYKENAVIADLSGTSNAIEMELSEKVVDSILVYGLNHSLNTLSLYNHSTEKYFQVLKPSSSWLTVQDPKWPARSYLLATPFVKSHLKQMLLKVKKPVENWVCSREGWAQFSSLDPHHHMTTSDHLRKTWAADCPLFDIVGSTEGGLSLRLKNKTDVLLVEAGTLQSSQWEPGQIWNFKFGY